MKQMPSEGAGVTVPCVANRRAAGADGVVSSRPVGQWRPRPAASLIQATSYHAHTQFAIKTLAPPSAGPLRRRPLERHLSIWRLKRGRRRGSRCGFRSSLSPTRSQPVRLISPSQRRCQHLERPKTDVLNTAFDVNCNRRVHRVHRVRCVRPAELRTTQPTSPSASRPPHDRQTVCQG